MFYKPRKICVLINFFLLLAILGCASVPKNQAAIPDVPPRLLSNGKPQIEWGMRILPLDLLASLLATPTKLILWDWRFCNHNISKKTEYAIQDYLAKNDLNEVKVRINQFAPFQEVGRAVTNKGVGVPYRIIAVPFTFLYAAVGRLLGGILISDYYDAYSNTMHIFSDDVAIVLHEAGHAKDFRYRKWRGTYALSRMLPGINLVQESLATDEAIDYLTITNQREEAVRAYKILYPAYASYVGGYLQAVPLGYIGAIIGGHIFGRSEARKAAEEFQKKDERLQFREERTVVNNEVSQTKEE